VRGSPQWAQIPPLRAGGRQRGPVPSPAQGDLKKMGKVRIVACSLVADMLGLKKDDFDPTLVDDVAGVATFLAEAATSDVVLYI